MALADDINQLRVDSLMALDASHNYYAHTSNAWRLVQQLVRQGHKVRIQNQATGTTVSENELPGLAQQYVTGYLASATFQHFVSLFEDFVSDFLRAWLIEEPRSLSGKKLQFRTVLDATDKTEIIRAVVDKELLGLGYKRLDDSFKYLEEIAKLGCPSQDQIERIAEIKASRNVLVHNRGIANALYIKKSMGQARFGAGEKMEIPEHYHRESWQLMKQVISDVANAAINKL